MRRKNTGYDLIITDRMCRLEGEGGGGSAILIITERMNGDVTIIG